ARLGPSRFPLGVAPRSAGPCTRPGLTRRAWRARRRPGRARPLRRRHRLGARDGRPTSVAGQPVARLLCARAPRRHCGGSRGDDDTARGAAAEATRQHDLVRAIEALNHANGINGDLELARFDADHVRDPGADPAATVALARAALAERPTIYAEDVLGWALSQTGDPGAALPHARAAVRLGTADALLWYHLAVNEVDLGMRSQAAADLGHAFAIN